MNTFLQWLQSYLIASTIIILVYGGWFLVGDVLNLLDRSVFTWVFWLLFFPLGTAITAWRYKKSFAIIYTLILYISIIGAMFTDSAFAVFYWTGDNFIFISIVVALISISPYKIFNLMIINNKLSQLSVKSDFKGILAQIILLILAFILTYIMLFLFILVSFKTDYFDWFFNLIL